MTIISTSDMDFRSLMYGSCSWRWSWTYFWRWWATASSLQTPPTQPVHDQPSPSPISPLHLFCLTSLQGFCSSFTLIDLKASISPSYPQTEVILMCKEPFWMIRYMNMSCSAHWYVILWMQPDTFGFINYFRYYINYINYVYYLFKMRKIDNVKSICQVIWLSVF